MELGRCGNHHGIDSSGLRFGHPLGSEALGDPFAGETIRIRDPGQFRGVEAGQDPRVQRTHRARTDEPDTKRHHTSPSNVVSVVTIRSRSHPDR